MESVCDSRIPWGLSERQLFVVFIKVFGVSQVREDWVYPRVPQGTQQNRLFQIGNILKNRCFIKIYFGYESAFSRCGARLGCRPEVQGSFQTSMRNHDSSILNFVRRLKLETTANGPTRTKEQLVVSETSVQSLQYFLGPVQDWSAVWRSWDYDPPRGNNPLISKISNRKCRKLPNSDSRAIFHQYFKLIHNSEPTWGEWKKQNLAGTTQKQLSQKLGCTSWELRTSYAGPFQTHFSAICEFPEKKKNLPPKIKKSKTNY